MKHLKLGDFGAKLIGLSDQEILKLVKAELAENKKLYAARKIPKFYDGGAQITEHTKVLLHLQTGSADSGWRGFPNQEGPSALDHAWEFWGWQDPFWVQIGRPRVEITW